MKIAIYLSAWVSSIITLLVFYSFRVAAYTPCSCPADSYGFGSYLWDRLNYRLSYYAKIICIPNAGCHKGYWIIPIEAVVTFAIFSVLLINNRKR